MACSASLDYQELPIPGKRIGRYINHDGPRNKPHVDLHVGVNCMINDARENASEKKLGLEKSGFELIPNCESKVSDFMDELQLKSIYYSEIQKIVKLSFEKNGAKVKSVLVFDHTLRESSVKNLNTSTSTATAGSVVRVHCDYTDVGAPIRLKQLCEMESYTGVKFDQGTVESVLNGKTRYAFVNVWRSIDKLNPVLQKPLALCDPRSVSVSDFLEYELCFDNRTGRNFSLPANAAHKHDWYYYSKMHHNECLVFKVYDRKESDNRFVFHTAFDLPHENEVEQNLLPPRRSIEARTVVIFEEEIPKEAPIIDCQQNLLSMYDHKPFFFDMKHSNNAARIRLWIQFMELTEAIDSKMIVYADLTSEEYQKVNPLKKVPAFVTAEGTCLFESFVIMQYLEDVYGPTWLLPENVEDRAKMNLLVRIHDVYIASPNCTQPGFSHSQGAMYLAPYATEHCAAERTMNRPTRAAKIKDIWKFLNWLDKQIFAYNGNRMSNDETIFLAGTGIPTHADITWFPTVVFMEYLLPHNFGWDERIFATTMMRDERIVAVKEWNEISPLPNFTRWYKGLQSVELGGKYFCNVRQEIWDFWAMKDEAGMFDPIRNEDVIDKSFKWIYP